MTRKPKRRKKKDRERRAEKRRAKPKAQSVSIQEYYQLAFLHYVTELQDRYSPEPWAGRSAFWRTFVRETQAVAAVRDDHVIAIYAVSDAGLVPYFVMEFVAGITLAELIKRNGALELKDILRIGVQIAVGLAATHAQGLVRP